MGGIGRIPGVAAVVAALTVVLLAVGNAGAQSEAPPTGDDPASLLDRLAALERDLPQDPPPRGAELDAETTWGALDGDASGVSAVLDTVESDLRQLFVDADDAAGDVAEAVALVARGWLDVWTGTSSIAVADEHDLAFPLDATDDFEVAAGADELRGEVEVGLELVLQGRLRHLEGYGRLQELAEAEADAQPLFDARAEAAEDYDREVRPVLRLLLSEQTATVMVPVDRFETDAPGVESRATSFEVACVDRAALAELEGPLTSEELAALPEVDRVDCPALPVPEHPEASTTP